MKEAIWRDCPGVVNEGKEGHALRDSCTSCAPFWERFPACPECGANLLKLGRARCQGCGTLIMVKREEAR